MVFKISLIMVWFGSGWVGCFAGFLFFVWFGLGVVSCGFSCGFSCVCSCSCSLFWWRSCFFFFSYGFDVHVLLLWVWCRWCVYILDLRRILKNKFLCSYQKNNESKNDDDDDDDDDDDNNKIRFKVGLEKKKFKFVF